MERDGGARVGVCVPLCQPLLVGYSGSFCHLQSALLAVLRAWGRNGDAFAFPHTMNHVPGGRIQSKLSCFIRDNARTEQAKPAGRTAWYRNIVGSHPCRGHGKHFKKHCSPLYSRDFTRSCFPGWRYLSKA